MGGTLGDPHLLDETIYRDEIERLSHPPVLFVDFDPGRCTDGTFRIGLDDGQFKPLVRTFYLGSSYPGVAVEHDRSAAHGLRALSGFVEDHTLRPFQLDVLHFYLGAVATTIEVWLESHRCRGMYDRRLYLNPDQYRQLRRHWWLTYWLLRGECIGIVPDALLD